MGRSPAEVIRMKEFREKSGSQPLGNSSPTEQLPGLWLSLSRLLLPGTVTQEPHEGSFPPSPPRPRGRCPTRALRPSGAGSAPAPSSALPAAAAASVCTPRLSRTAAPPPRTPLLRQAYVSPALLPAGSGLRAPGAGKHPTLLDALTPSNRRRRGRGGSARLGPATGPKALSPRLDTASASRAKEQGLRGRGV